MPYFNFNNLIRKYSRNFTFVQTSEGHYDDMGDWAPGEKSESVLSGAIIGFAETKLYRENSTLTADDKRLFMLSELPGALTDSYVLFEGNKYKIEEERGKENAVFTGVFSYTLKRVSAFND